VSVHIGVFDNFYQSTRDIRDKAACVSARLSLGQGGRVIVRCQCISGDPDVNRDVCLSLSCSFLFLVCSDTCKI